MPLNPTHWTFKRKRRENPKPRILDFSFFKYNLLKCIFALLDLMKNWGLCESFCKHWLPKLRHAIHGKLNNTFPVLEKQYWLNSVLIFPIFPFLHPPPRETAHTAFLYVLQVMNYNCKGFFFFLKSLYTVVYDLAYFVLLLPHCDS